MKRFLVAIPVLLGLLPIGAAAQSVATAELHVSVKDPNGRLVTNAKVTVRDESRGIERTLENRPDGEYPFLSLPPGQYTVTVEAGGFARVTAVGVRVTVGQAAELPVMLSVSGQKTEVTVSGETEMVETQQTSVSTTINQQRIDN
ncbi:MAG TPA: carboxypeptidase-like regulatory domain-containing protein, partial [Terriglobales bacterium]|nr:carboxypeptidase-like regulatory domain-containing protein [Terriglobales bacterium]